MATYGHTTINQDFEKDAKERIQRILDGLGAVQGVNYAFLVTDTGSPLMVARTTPTSDEIVNDVSVLIADIVSTMIEEY